MLLTMMGEPMLACGPFAEDEVYRFIFSAGASASSPLSVRLSRTESTHILVARQYVWTAREVPPHPFAVAASRVRPVTDVEWRDLVAELRRTGFWEMPAGDEAADDRGGATWEIEGRIGRGYHHVQRHAPEGGPFRELSAYLLRLAGLEDPLP
jgi:hypothetical protein